MPAHLSQPTPDSKDSAALHHLSAGNSRPSPLSADDALAEHGRFDQQPVLLTIAGFDPSSGAGVTADLKTFAAHKFFGTSAVTALTVQSTLGVRSVEPVTAALLRETLEFLGADLPPVGVKIGMLGSPDNAETIAAFIESLTTGTSSKAMIPIVVDPVIQSSSGKELASQATLRSLEKNLLPLVDWITPNWPELATLAGMPVVDLPGAETALHALAERYPSLSIVVTGGDQDHPIDLLRLANGEVHRFYGEHIESSSTHGTGCAFSSALLCYLANGDNAVSAVAAAKEFVAEAIRRAKRIGRGKGPLHLLWPLEDHSR